VVASFHWGIERATLETAEQRQLAQTAAAAGAQLVIRAHPHVLQPVRREGTALVAYSLGNFVFGAASAETTATGILEADLSADGVAAARWRAGHIAGERPLTKRLPGACRSATRTRWRPAYSSERRQSTRLPVARLGDQGAPPTSAGATLS
jgi:hypothetical protein